MAKKQIRVMASPLTFIMVDLDVDEEQAKKDFLEKYNNLRKPLNEEQKRRERTNIRGGRTLQRRKY
jgi:hypothetical protein